MPSYKHYNNFSEKDKDSMRTKAADDIYASVDQVESMIAGDGSDSGIHGRLDAINAHLANIELAIDDAKTAIVNAINSHA